MSKNSNKSSGSSKALNAGLWAAQILMAGMFGMAGVMKTFKPIAELSQNLPWTSEVSVYLVRFIGISELAAALGLLLPAFLRFLPGILTSLAGLGLAVIMVLALGFHIMRGEYMPAIPLNATLGIISLFIAWGRYRKLPV